MAELLFGERGKHDGFNEDGHWFQHLYPVDDAQCWCGWKPAEVMVTAAQHGVMNSDGTWTVENWDAGDVAARSREDDVR